jgi:hypothetical protein
MQFVPVQTPAGTAFLPVCRPSVWTYWRNSPIPIPPPAAPTHSIYLGVLLPEDASGGSFAVMLENARRLRWSSLFPRFDFVQPVLVEGGLAPFLDDFIEAIDSAGLSRAATRSRILQLPAASISPLLEFTDDHLRAAAPFIDLVALYTKKRRYDIRRAQQLGLTVQVATISTDDEARAVYSSIMQVHQESWTRTGLGPHSLEYWVGMSKAVRESGGHDLVSRTYGVEGELLSVAVVHVMGKSAFYHMNSTTIEGQKVSASPYGLHAVIVAANLVGAELFELGRHSEGESAKASTITQYKAEFGGTEHPVPNFSLTTPFGR